MDEKRVVFQVCYAYDRGENYEIKTKNLNISHKVKVKSNFFLELAVDLL